MPLVAAGKENSAEIQLHYEDHGSGPAVVLIHGWPLSGRSWEKQIPALLADGFRVITYDRRGFGQSSQPASGYDYNVLAQDLNAVVAKLSLEDFALVGFSMGGGEVARYVGRYGTKRVRQAVFISAVTPYLRKAADNPEGVEPKVFDEIQEAIAEDRPAFLTSFFKSFYNLRGGPAKEISEEAVRAGWITAVNASPIGTAQCVGAWGEDFRADLKKLDRPALVVHGTADSIVPLEAAGRRMPSLIKDCRLEIIEGAPHGLTWTHAQRLNERLLDFLKQGVGAAMAGARA